MLKPQSLISFKERDTDHSPTQVEMKEFAEFLEKLPQMTRPLN